LQPQSFQQKKSELLSDPPVVAKKLRLNVEKQSCAGKQQQTTLQDV
jgi:hypothetical protein